MLPLLVRNRSNHTYPAYIAVPRRFYAIDSCPSMLSGPSLSKHNTFWSFTNTSFCAIPKKTAQARGTREADTARDTLQYPPRIITDAVNETFHILGAPYSLLKTAPLSTVLS